MVNTGRPSRACATCKQRRIKCDQALPSCTPCRKSGWPCPGMPSEMELCIRQYSKPRRANGSKSGSRLGSPSTSLSVPATDRATTFFIHHYVWLADDGGGRGNELASVSRSSRGTHEYLPTLLEQSSATEAFKAIVAASGLAAMVNAGNSTIWLTEAYALYSKAIRLLRDDLNDPVRSKLDDTLATIMLMGTFEVIVSGNAASMASFGQHTLAAALCIQVRGKRQFRNEASVRLFVQLRRIIVMTCHQLLVPIPYALRQWSQWAEAVQTAEEIPSNRFSEINERLADARAEIKQRRITSPAVVAMRLLEFDEEFEAWRRDLPASWQYRSYRSMTSAEGVGDRFNGQYDMYPDVWIAANWNSYRSIRLMIHEAVITATLKYGSTEEKANLSGSMKVLEGMTAGICSSVAYLMGHRRDGPSVHKSEDAASTSSRTPGGYLLLWPLFLAGMLRTTSKPQRAWITDKIRRIGITMGVHLAISMARALEEHNKSFSDEEVWFIGQFYP